MSNKLVRNVIWTGKNTKEIFDLLEKVGDRVNLVYDAKRSKNGLSRSMNMYGRRNRKFLKMVSFSSHIAVIEFVGVI